MRGKPHHHHIACTLYVVFFRVPSGVTRKQVRTVNNAAKLTAPARRVFHNMADDHILLRQFEHHSARSVFSALWGRPDFYCHAFKLRTSTPTTGCGARSTSLWVHRNLFRQMLRDGNLYFAGMLHATTASPTSSAHIGGWVNP